MTDDEYFALLRALAGKHLRPLRYEKFKKQVGDPQQALERISSSARLLKTAMERGEDAILDRLHAELTSIRNSQPTRRQAGQRNGSFRGKPLKSLTAP